MPVATVDKAPSVSADSNRSSFFRQSGWLMIATVGGGAFMWAVHLLNNVIPPSAYAEFGVFLAVTMCVPITPVQMILAQQTAKAVALNREHELSGLIRSAWAGILVVWAVCTVVVLIFQQTILVHWRVTHPIALYLTLPVVLLTAWLPMFWGVLQGRQNFLWLGWSMMLQGVARFSIAAFAVWLIRKFDMGSTGFAAGILGGVLGGLALSLIIAVWATRPLWLPKPVPFDWRALMLQVLPLLFGFGAYQILLTADTMFVKACFDDSQAAPYVGAGTLARATTWLVGPLAAVMFPKLVHAKAKSEKSNLMNIVLIGTLVLSTGGALALTIVCWWVPLFLNIMYHQMSGPVGNLLPWYAWAVVPLSLANVLVNNLLAKSLFKVVPALCVLVPLYIFALTQFHTNPEQIIKTLGVFNTLLLIVCAWYTWGKKHKTEDVPAPEPTL